MKFSQLTDIQRRLDFLKGVQNTLSVSMSKKEEELASIESYLSRSQEVERALTFFSDALFKELIRIIEKQLSLALQEVLQQRLELKIQSSVKRGVTSIEFYIERDGHEEDIMLAQGGSVINILSVGLRLFALTTLGNEKHRKFLRKRGKSDS